MMNVKIHDGGGAATDKITAFFSAPHRGGCELVLTHKRTPGRELVHVKMTGANATELNEAGKELRELAVANGWAYKVRIPSVAQSAGMSQGYAIIGKEDPEAAVQLEVDTQVVEAFRVVALAQVKPEDYSVSAFYPVRERAMEACAAFNRGEDTFNPNAAQYDHVSRWAVVYNR